MYFIRKTVYQKKKEKNVIFWESYTPQIRSETRNSQMRPDCKALYNLCRGDFFFFFSIICGWYSI